MLVVTRRVGERLMIGEDHEVTLTVLGINGRQVRYGIEAPSHIKIDREELYKRKKSHARAKAVNDFNY